MEPCPAEPSSLNFLMTKTEAHRKIVNCRKHKIIFSEAILRTSFST